MSRENMEWKADKNTFEKTNLSQDMSRVYITEYDKFYDLSVTKRKEFWTLS